MRRFKAGFFAVCARQQRKSGDKLIRSARSAVEDGGRPRALHLVSLARYSDLAIVGSASVCRHSRPGARFTVRGVRPFLEEAGTGLIVDTMLSAALYMLALPPDRPLIEAEIASDRAVGCHRLAGAALGISIMRPGSLLVEPGRRVAQDVGGVVSTWPSLTGSVAPGRNEVRATPSLPFRR